MFLRARAHSRPIRCGTPPRSTVIAFLVYLFTLMRIVFRNVRTPPSSIKCDSGYELQSVLTTADLDCELALLWQTQAPTLEKLRQGGGEGLPVQSLCTLYCCFTRSNPELCEGSDFKDWVSTLERAEVIAREDETIRITEKGLFMLDFVKQQTRCPCEESALVQRH
jgi:hypothetical protein